MGERTSLDLSFASNVLLSTSTSPRFFSSVSTNFWYLWESSLLHRVKVHKYVCTDCMYVCMHIHMFVHGCVRISFTCHFLDVRTQPYVRTCTNICTHHLLCQYITHVYVHVYVHSNIQKHTHTYTHAHTHLLFLNVLFGTLIDGGPSKFITLGSLLDSSDLLVLVPLCVLHHPRLLPQQPICLIFLTLLHFYM